MFIEFNNDTEMRLHTLEYGVDVSDGKKKVFATYVYDEDNVKCFAEIKTVGVYPFNEKATVKELKDIGVGVRFRFEGVFDYGKR